MPTPTRASFRRTPCSSRSTPTDALRDCLTSCAPPSSPAASQRRRDDRRAARRLMRARRLLPVVAALALVACATAAPLVSTVPLSDDDLTTRARLLAMADARRPDSALLEL